MAADYGCPRLDGCYCEQSLSCFRAQKCANDGPSARPHCEALCQSGAAIGYALNRLSSRHDTRDALSQPEHLPPARKPGRR